MKRILAIDEQGNTSTPLLRRLSVYDVIGVVGDGVADDAVAINAALAAAEGGVIHFEAGKFLIGAQLNVQSNTTVILSPGTEIVCSGINVRSFYLSDKQNVRIVGNGATITKPRTAAGSSSAYVLGCWNTQIDGLRINGSAKDGIYVGAGTNGAQCVNTRITNCVINDCRRQGISVVHAKGTVIAGCEIYGTTGDAPAAGIDLEANADTVVEGTVIRDCYIHDNADQGGIAVFKASRTTIAGCVIENNLVGVNIDTAGTAINYHAVTVDPATDLIELVGHGFAVGDLVKMKPPAGGAMPAGAPSTTYVMFVLSVPDADHFTLSLDYKANPVNFTSAGSNVLAGKYDLSTNSHTTISDCHFRGNSHGVYGENSGPATVSGCSFVDNYGGVNLLKMPGCTVANNSIEQSRGGRGIYLTHRGAAVTGNHLNGCQEEGIEIVGTEKSTVSGNVLLNCGEVSDFGIFIKHAADCVIANNTVTCDPALNVTYGIVMDNPNTYRCLLTGNNVAGCGTSDANSLIVGANNFAVANVRKSGALSP